MHPRVLETGLTTSNSKNTVRGFTGRRDVNRVKKLSGTESRLAYVNGCHCVCMLRVYEVCM